MAGEVEKVWNQKTKTKKTLTLGIAFTMCEDLMMENILNSDAQVASFLLDGKSVLYCRIPENKFNTLQQ